MRKLPVLILAAGIALLGGCASLFGGASDRPDEFAVARNAPLVIPPDYSLVPPRPGDPRPQAADAQAQALEALFGGVAPRSASENTVLGAAGRNSATDGARSVAGDPGTTVVEKGALTRDIIAAPEGNGQDATVARPGATPAPATPVPTTPPATTQTPQ